MYILVLYYNIWYTQADVLRNLILIWHLIVNQHNFLIVHVLK